MPIPYFVDEIQLLANPIAYPVPATSWLGLLTGFGNARHNPSHEAPVNPATHRVENKTRNQQYVKPTKRAT